MTLLYIMIGLAVGALIGWLLGRSGQGALRGRIAAMEEERERTASETDRRLADSDRLWQSRLDTLREEMAVMSRDTLSARQEDLQETNRRQIGDLLRPIREEMDAFRRSVEEGRTAGEVAKEDIKHSFESMLRLFEQQQLNAVGALREQAECIRRDARDLSRVLRSDSKTQGDWGEMILESLLESSGLEKDTHYFVQENVKDAEGHNFRPDVVVRFPEGRSVIIDSKVSLTAYARSREAQTDAERRRELREHVRSVRRHVDELAGKRYDTLVKDSIGLVLMFIPNDNCCLTALEEDPELGRYAYSRGIVIISPSNLMIALQLAYNMWQQDRRGKNIETIVKTAGELYDKVAGMSETFEDLGSHIDRLTQAYEKTRSQLYEGRGNIMRRMESLRDLGLTPRKRIRGLD